VRHSGAVGEVLSRSVWDRDGSPLSLWIVTKNAAEAAALYFSRVAMIVGRCKGKRAWKGTTRKRKEEIGCGGRMAPAL
jgi:hypothetical protein